MHMLISSSFHTTFLLLVPSGMTAREEKLILTKVNICLHTCVWSKQTFINMCVFSRKFSVYTDFHFRFRKNLVT